MLTISRRKFIQYGALTAGTGAIAACRNAQNTTSFSNSSASPEVRIKKEKVVASWLSIMQTTAYYVALKEGLFEQADIEVDSVKFENPNQIIDSLVSNRADFGSPGAAAGITVLAEAKAPGTFKVYGLQGGGIKSGFINDGLIVKSDSAIQSFKDLQGLKWALFQEFNGKQFYPIFSAKTVWNQIQMSRLSKWLLGYIFPL